MWWLIIVLSVILIVGIECASWSLKRELPADSKKETVVQYYSPNLKVWALGIILGTECVILSYFTDVVKSFKQTSWEGVVLSLGTLLILLGFVGIFLWAIVKIVKED